MTFSLYRDRNGVPAELVVETESADFTAGRVPADWYCYYGAHAPLDAGAYWVVIRTEVIRASCATTTMAPQTGTATPDSYADGGAPQFGNGGTGEGTMSLYINYFPEPQLPSAGRRTVGPQVSSPMSSSFKPRARSFVGFRVGLPPQSQRIRRWSWRREVACRP